MGLADVDVNVEITGTSVVAVESRLPPVSGTGEVADWVFNLGFKREE